MNKLYLEPITSKLLQIENNTTKQLNNLESKKEFLQDFKSFLENSDERSLLIDRIKLKKAKNEIKTRHQLIFEENNNKSPYIIPTEIPMLKKTNVEYLSINNAYKLNNSVRINYKNNHQANDGLKSSYVSSPNNNYFVVCSKNSKNSKNLKLFDEIKKQETKNEFYEALNIINNTNNTYFNTKTKANTTKSIGVDTNSDFNYINIHNNKNTSNFNVDEAANKKAEIIDYLNSNDKTQKVVIKQHQTNDQIIIQQHETEMDYYISKQQHRPIKEKLEKKKGTSYNTNNKNNNNYDLTKLLGSSIDKKTKKKLNCDIENILTDENLFDLIRNEKEKEKVKAAYSSGSPGRSNNVVNKKVLNNDNHNNYNEKVSVMEKVKSPPPRYLKRLKTSPKLFVNYKKNLSENSNSSNSNVYINKIFNDTRSEDKNNAKQKINKKMKSHIQVNLALTEWY